MNYRHSYHAGGAADVFKHFVLTVLLAALRKKDKPMFYLDTHAGNAQYDLNAADSQKTGEYRTGIEKLWHKNNLGAEMQAYLAIIKAANKKNLRFYPGSPSIAAALLRPQDRAIFCEQHPLIHHDLQTQFANNRQIRVLEQDGYQSLKAFLPPPERRGLVLIDPPFEHSQEFSLIIENLLAGYRRWSTGTYAIWYPIKDQRKIQQFHQQFIKTDISRILITECYPLPPDVPLRLNGSGMIIINPPWQADQQIGHTLPQLLNYLDAGQQGTTRTFWLAPESTP